MLSSAGKSPKNQHLMLHLFVNSIYKESNRDNFQKDAMFLINKGN